MKEQVQEVNESKIKAWPKVAIIVLNWNRGRKGRRNAIMGHWT